MMARHGSMGIFRFLLAALVVLFHFGGLSWIVGRIAVYAFYCISGFLIFQVLDRVYLQESQGVRRFFANRFVRLAPLYATYTVLTVVLLLAGGSAFQQALTIAGVPVADASLRTLLRSTLTLSPLVGVDGWLPILRFDPPLIPQGWSIGVEAVFYVCAPLVVLATRRRPLWMACWLAGGLLVTASALRLVGVDFERFQVVVYKNAVASAVVFLLGGACYFARRQWGRFVAAPVAWAAVGVWVVLITVPVFGGTFPLPSSAVFAQYLWLTLVATCLVLLAAPVPMRLLDTGAGNLCYGVYLNHFLVAAILLPTNVGRFVGEAGTVGFGLAVLAGSTAVAAATWAVVERPFDRVRARVRGVRVRESAHVGGWPSQRWAVAGATVLALLAGPVGWTVERLNGAAAGAALTMSGPFNIRWKPGISDPVRHRIEAELGLLEQAPVTRDPRHRTWEYRLPAPTRARVRALVTHPAVEDTARIDVQRFEIAQ
jgi:peptidoglycan/LPS O-acetylase OafA/YrhL